jgi:uncharacterized protein YbjT (DUF2867 family)
MHVLVVGATGLLGTEICRRAIKAGHRVRGLVRESSEPGRVSGLRDLGVELVHGDLGDRPSLDRAVAGVDAVVSTATATGRGGSESIEGVDRAGQLSLVEAARDAGVRRFVHVSYSADIGGDDPLTRAKREVEWRVRESGMTWTILKPSCFMEAWLGPALGFDYPNRKVTLFGTGEAPLSYISLYDVAAFAVYALDSRETENEDIELGGPEPVSPAEAVRIFEEELGEPIAVEHVPEEALTQQAEAAPDPLERSFGALMLGCARGNPIDMEATIRRHDLRLTSVREYAAKAVRGEAVPG